MINNCPAKDKLKPTLPDVAALPPGAHWGAYWKHPDGWMKLVPPCETIRDQAHTVQHAAALHDAARDSDLSLTMKTCPDLDNDPEDEKFLVLFVLIATAAFGVGLLFLAV